MVTLGGAHFDEGRNTGRMRPLGLHEIKVLEEKMSTAKGKFTRLLIWPGLPVDKVNAEQRRQFLSQVQWGNHWEDRDKGPRKA